MAKQSDITPALLRQLFTYDADTGLLFHNARTDALTSKGKTCGGTSNERWNATRAGKQAFGSTIKGYAQANVRGHHFLAHRVAWAIHYGEWPDGEVDHINGVRTDNRIANLRVVDTAGNAKNKRMPDSNTSGAVGVSWDKSRNRWAAYIKVSGKKVSLGRFKDFSAAVARRVEAAQRYGFHANHGRD